MTPMLTHAALAALLVLPAALDPERAAPGDATRPAVQKVIIDSDFAMPPVDDALALMLALNSPELEILGLTTVGGNESLDQATADLLRFLEVVGREDVPVFRGASKPLVHRPSEFARRRWGRWWWDGPALQPAGGFSTRKARSTGAAEFIVDAARAHPGEVTLVALGPLTNVAQALRLDPSLGRTLRRIVITGGAIAALPDGAGNQTPNAEFNFWVDPDAARIVLRSGARVTLSPLNVSRKAAFTKGAFDRILAADTRFSRLLGKTMGPRFLRDPTKRWLMYDPVAVASLVDSSLVETTELVVDVDDHPGISYGVSVGGAEAWPGAEGAPKVLVQHGLDWERFIQMFIERMTRYSGRGIGGAEPSALEPPSPTPCSAAQPRCR